MKKAHNERKSKKKSKILLTTVGNEIVLSFFFLSLFVLFLNVLSPLMSLFFFHFPFFFFMILGEQKRIVKVGKERKRGANSELGQFHLYPCGHSGGRAGHVQHGVGGDSRVKE